MTPADTGTLLDTAFWTSVGAILLLLILSGFFSGSETALTAASRGKLRAKADKGDKKAERALVITEDNERLIGSVLLGNNFVNILASALATALFTRLFGDSGVAYATIIMTLLVLIFAEILPKTYAFRNANQAARDVAPVVNILVSVLSPVTAVINFVVGAILKVFRIKYYAEEVFGSTAEELRGAIELHAGEDEDDEEQGVVAEGDAHDDADGVGQVEDRVQHHRGDDGDPGAEREPGDPAGRGVRVLRLNPVERRGGVAELSRAVVEHALRTADAAEIKPERGKPPPGENLIQFVDDLVVHGAAVLRMRMQQQRQRRIDPIGGVITAFQAAFGAIENDFGHDVRENLLCFFEIYLSPQLG